MSLQAELTRLVEAEGPERVMDAVLEWFARDMDKRRRCYKTGRPISSPIQCLYCKRRCLLAGREMIWKEA